MSRTIEIGCGWANGCGHGEDTIEVDSFDDFVAKFERFFDGMCGMSAVDSFYAFGEGDAGHEWDNEGLPRNKDLSNVWKTKKKDLEIFFNACD